MLKDRLHLTKKDFKIEWFSGTGKGGQHRNKHQNCCRIIHNESGLRSQSAEARDRITNQRLAFNRLAKMLIDHYFPKKDKKRHRAKDVIRIYNSVRNDVIDVESKIHSTFGLVSNDLSLMIESRKKALMDKSDE